jgi:hypothetical protein
VQRTAARRDGAEVSVSSPDGQLKRPMPRPATADRVPRTMWRDVFAP